MKKNENGAWCLKTTDGSNKVELSIFYKRKKRVIHSFTCKEDIDDFIETLVIHRNKAFR